MMLARGIVALLAGLIAALFGVTAPAAVLTSESTVAAYTYGGHQVTEQLNGTSAERGPPLTYASGASGDLPSHGASARSGDAISPATYTYDGTARFARTTRDSHGAKGPEGGRPAPRGVALRLHVAANTAVKVCANSFTGETLVLMADGTKKPIKDVTLGDEVMATDPETGETGPRKVIDLIRHDGLHTMVAVRLSDGSTIDATDGHPFWVESHGEWVDATDLQPGDVVVTANGDRLTVASLGISEQDLTAYNLTVEGLHTYYAGGDSVLVHNAGCANITEAGLAHSFDRHAAQWFGGQPTKAGQMAEWQGLIERTAGSSKVVPWSSGSTLTNAHIARIDGVYFVAQFDRGSGDLVTALVPKNDQLSAMLRLLGQ